MNIFDIPGFVFYIQCMNCRCGVSQLFSEFAMTLLGRSLFVAWILVLGATTSWAQGLHLYLYLYKLSDIL